MAFLDVSDILLDPDFTDTFNVKRRVTTTSVHGRVETQTEDKPNIVGVICAASQNDLERHPEVQFMGRHLSIVTRFRLQGPSPGYQPDILEWRGDLYVIQAVDPYPQYGVGFVQAIAGSIDSMDAQFPQPQKSDEVFGGTGGDAE